MNREVLNVKAKAVIRAKNMGRERPDTPSSPAPGSCCTSAFSSNYLPSPAFKVFRTGFFPVLLSCAIRILFYDVCIFFINRRGMLSALGFKGCVCVRESVSECDWSQTQ